MNRNLIESKYKTIHELDNLRSLLHPSVEVGDIDNGNYQVDELYRSILNLIKQIETIVDE